MDEKGHEMLDCMMPKAGATGYRDFKIFRKKSRCYPGIRDPERKESSEGAGGSKNQI